MSTEDFTELMEQNIKVHELADVQIKRLQSEMIELQLRVTELERRKVDEISEFSEYIDIYCGGCLFWQEGPDGKEMHGTCRRSPPNHEGWPGTNFREWCGSFKPTVHNEIEGDLE